MTVLLDDRTAEPGTHVLLIGVGAYPHLKDGTANSHFSMPMGMGQLSSPPRSVQALAHWFTDTVSGFNNPVRPLRSLQALCSDSAAFSMNNDAGISVPIERARMPAVNQAVLDWIDRAGSHPENLAIFFFCGHGLAFAETENALLLEDFGANALDPMRDAIAFDAMRLGVMRHCAARYQCHFVDACRTPPSKEFLETFGFNSNGNPIASAGLSRNLRDKIAPVYFATGLASAAYGLPGQASLFTQGLLRSMLGAASRDKDDHWEVQVPAIAEGVNKCVESLAFQSQPQYCQPRDTGPDFSLHRLRKDPEVIVKVFTRNEEILPQTVLAHEHQSTLVPIERRPPIPLPWWVSLPAGLYRFEAVSAADNSQVLNNRIKYVTPPATEVGL